MQPVSNSGPADGENPFEGMPFLGDLGKLLGGMGQGRGLQWDTTRQVAMQLAAGGEAEPNVDPMVRMDIEELSRIADMHVATTTGLATSASGSGASVVPVTRSQWVQRSFDAFRPLFESLSTSLGQAPDPQSDHPSVGGEDPFGAMFSQLMGAMAPMMLSVTAGGLLGHMAQRSFGQYDLPVPRNPSDELMLVLPNVDEFGADWSIEPRDLRLWVCLHEIAHHAVLSVPHVRSTLEELIREYASGFSTDASGLVEKLEGLELSGPEDLAGLQDVFGDPELMLGAIQSDAQRSMLPRLEAIVAVVVGYVDRVMDRIGSRLIGSYDMITEAARRRRVEADQSDRFVSRLFGLELGRATYERGTAFVDGVVDREGFEALTRLWERAEMLPTPAEIDAPGLWLARIELPDD